MKSLTQQCTALDFTSELWPGAWNYDFEEELYAKDDVSIAVTQQDLCCAMCNVTTTHRADLDNISALKSVHLDQTGGGRLASGHERYQRINCCFFRIQHTHSRVSNET